MGDYNIEVGLVVCLIDNGGMKIFLKVENGIKRISLVVRLNDIIWELKIKIYDKELIFFD